MAEMKCFTCVNFEKAKLKGKIKTSIASEDCWSPDWQKLSAELKLFYVYLSKLNMNSFNIFKTMWDGDDIKDHVTPLNKRKCYECNFYKKCAERPKRDSVPLDFSCSKWNLDWDKVPEIKEAQKELKEIVTLDIPSVEHPYITYFLEKLEVVNKDKPVKVFIGDKFEYSFMNQKIKLEVEHLTSENVIVSGPIPKLNKKSNSTPSRLRMSLLYSTLLDTKNISKVFERNR